MRFALLKADYVNDELLAEHGDLPEMFGRFLGGVALDVYEVRHHQLPDPARYDALLVTGSRFSVNDRDAWVLELLAFLRDVVKGRLCPVVGFCFGHQALAKALGGEVGRGPCEWNVGVWPLDELRRPLSVGAPVHALFNHREQVLVLPPGARALAGGPRCPVQVMAIGEQALGLQFHPEYTLAYQEALMGVARGMPSEVLADALARNRGAPRSDAVARSWILQLASYRRQRHEPLIDPGARA
jgi:GMP synthase-like glutamine amidotransferase